MTAFVKSIDIIIPSYRLDPAYILPLLSLPQPPGWQITYFLVVDNPRIKPSPEIQKRAEQPGVHLIINEKNCGASASRNKGIEAGSSPWILFLDDDVIADSNLLFQYAKAIEQHPEEIGFIGLTDFPEANSAFTRALQVNDLTFFKIAQVRDYFPWGPTANMVYNRKKMEGLRFSMDFPKNGGGEDVDLPLQICRIHQKEFKCLPQAKVTHPWWNQGKAHFDRFIRYGAGVSYLFPKHKERIARDFANPVETLVLLVLLFPIFFYTEHLNTWLILFLSIPVFEFIIVFLQARKVGVTGIKELLYVTLLKSSFQWGLLKGCFQQGLPHYFLCRMNIGSPKTHHFRLNRWKIIKISLYLLLIALLYALNSG